MVPNTFTDEEVDIARKYVLSQIRRYSRFKNGKKLGNPFVFYKDVLAQIGYYIESEHDGDRAGILAARISEAEFSEHGVLIGAVIVSQEYRRPGPGFYVFAEENGLFNCHGNADPDGARELNFWDQHVTEIVRHYGRQR